MRCPTCLEQIDKSQVPVVNGQGDLLSHHDLTTGRLQRKLTGAKPGTLTKKEVSAGGRFVCHNFHELPPDLVKGVELVPVAMVGLSRASKTHYSTVMLHALADQGALAGAGLSFTFPSDSNYRRYKTQVAQLVDDHRVLPTTQKRYDDAGNLMVQDPTVLKAHLIRDAVPPEKSGYLSLYDCPGELVTDMQAQASGLPYLAGAQMLLFFVDPVSLRDNGQPLVTRGQDDLVGGLDVYPLTAAAQRIRQDRGITGGRISDIPLAIVISKSDLLIDPDPRLREYQQALSSRTDYGNRPLRQVLDEVHGRIEIAQRFIEQFAPGLYGAAANTFENRAFFFVSATGCEPDDAGNFPHVSPHGVLDPLLWGLAARRWF